ncbi:MAG: alpha/beta hydrolase [Bacteroidetes bacterium CG12_big_fil_rev_8_21_14_0_65_60_17]|nr:MAG: alpha/beta hydrolase [Bacteroidetes bacterium CG12_big_fil_rev_8_21_14_0_65_60_17]
MPRHEYSPPLLLRNGHLNTIVGGRLRRVPPPDYARERIDTPDGDFLDLDWAFASKPKTSKPESGNTPADRARHAVVIAHGLEGNSDKPYIRGMVRTLTQAGHDVVAWNFRGCSGEPNRQLHFYHSGATDDLDTVLRHVRTRYDHVALVGFSMGGNKVLKYLGEQGDRALADAGVTFSVPCDLTTSAEVIERRENRIYLKRFIRSMQAKVAEKASLFPGLLDTEGLEKIVSFREFDDRYTAPLHGFRDALDYWEKASCIHVLEDIRRPALLINAQDDSFLSPSCTPDSDNPYLEVDTPRFGGHIGFVTRRGPYYTERRTLEFLARIWSERDGRRDRPKAKQPQFAEEQPAAT